MPQLTEPPANPDDLNTKRVTIVPKLGKIHIPRSPQVTTLRRRRAGAVGVVVGPLPEDI